MRLGWWLISRIVRDAVPVDGMLWVDVNACGSRLEDSAATTRASSYTSAEPLGAQPVQSTDGSALG